MKPIPLILLMLTLRAYAADPILPDPKLTPGDVLTNVTIETICAKGYANVLNGGARNMPESEKREIFIEYFGSVPANPGRWEIDHLCPVSIGGSNEKKNGWPQDGLTQPFNYHTKDRLELHLYTSLQHTLKSQGHDIATALWHQYQHEIMSNWTNTYVKYLGQPPPVPLMSPKASASKSVGMANGKP